MICTAFHFQRVCAWSSDRQGAATSSAGKNPFQHHSQLSSAVHISMQKTRSHAALLRMCFQAFPAEAQQVVLHHTHTQPHPHTHTHPRAAEIANTIGWHIQEALEFLKTSGNIKKAAALERQLGLSNPEQQPESQGSSSSEARQSVPGSPGSTRDVPQAILEQLQVCFTLQRLPFPTGKSVTDPLYI